jgi:hypothetical protein
MQGVAHRQSSDKGQRWCLRISRLQANNGAGEHITRRTFPTAPHPATATVLCIGAKPQTFWRTGGRALQQVGVGRPG